MLLADAGSIVRGDTNVELVFGILLFAVAGTVFVVSALTVGKLIRPALPHPEKAAAYECGEPAIGDSWVQFDLRFYIVALFFIIFDVEIAMLWPWAVVYKDFSSGGLGGGFALYAMLFFLAPILVGFAYEWRCGYLDWVRASMGQRSESLSASTNRSASSASVSATGAATT
jgi:NADH-quinone oxidoreductase subunit A